MDAMTTEVWKVQSGCAPSTAGIESIDEAFCNATFYKYNQNSDFNCAARTGTKSSFSSTTSVAMGTCNSSVPAANYVKYTCKDSTSTAKGTENECKATNAGTDVDAASFAHEVFCSVSNGESSVMKSAKSCSTAGTMCDTICPITNVDSIKANAKTMNLPADNIFWGCFTVSELLASRKKCGAGGSSPSLSSTAKFASPAVAAWLRAACGAVLVVACGNVS